MDTPVQQHNSLSTAFPWLQRRYTADSPGDPWSQFRWEQRDVVQQHAETGETIFEQRGVQVPRHWSSQAVQILATKYFRQTSQYPRETSLRQVVQRVLGAICEFAVRQSRLSESEAQVLADELAFMILDQRFSFNSPVWFNIGVPGRPQRASACFILDVQDTLESIYDWCVVEGRIFAGGAGAGVNLSNLRSSAEKLSSGHSATGPVSFMRMTDAAAGVIASGASTRKAAKMVILDVDHPDVQQFVWCKAHEGRKAQVLAQAGYKMGLDDHDMLTLAYQNANNSVRVSDQFMRAVQQDQEWALVARTTGEVVLRLPARQLFQEICEAAWECADPGLQYSDTIERWNAVADTQNIEATNPCGEFVFVNNSACNLASMNLLRYLDPESGEFDTAGFTRDCQLVLLAQELLVELSEYPTDEIRDNSLRLRPLGLGFTNLGALLMRLGLPYDSDAGRAQAAAVCSLMGAAATLASADFARRWGPYASFPDNRGSQLRVLGQHRQAAQQLVADFRGPDAALPVAQRALECWQQAEQLAAQGGVRNAQVTLLAPAGTISFMMDADTTGVEPDLALCKYKRLVGGGHMRIVNQSVMPALARLGYDSEVAEAIAQHMVERNSPIGAPGLDPEHYAVFACAMTDPSISPTGHVAMMGAVQPFLSGAISKTVNLPADASVQDVADVYMAAWEAGCKDIAIYRDGSKLAQPLVAGGGGEQDASPEAEVVADSPLPAPARRRLPTSRPAQVRKFSVGGLEGYMTVGLYEDGTPGELFVKVSKQGSTLEGVMDGLAIAVSLGLQYGVPLETFVAKFLHTRFEPAGITEDPDVRLASSLLDYIARRLALDYLPADRRAGLGVQTTAERLAQLPRDPEVATSGAPGGAPIPVSAAPVGTRVCGVCGGLAHLRGACWLCESCGTSSGCS